MPYSHVVPGSWTSGAFAMPVTNWSGVIMREFRGDAGLVKLCFRVRRFDFRDVRELSVGEARRMSEEILDRHLTLRGLPRGLAVLGDKHLHLGELRQELGHRISELHPTFLDQH